MKFKVGLVVGLIACGSSHGGNDNGGDASTTGGDANHDATTDAAPPPGLVRVHALDTTGAPVMGLHAVFVDADATQTDTQTDSTGVAQATVLAGASVTLVCDHNTHVQCTGVAALTTVQDLTPGDDVSLNVDAFGPRLVPLDSTSAGTFQVGTTNLPPSAGNLFGSNYRGPCGGTANKTTVATIAFQQGCVRSSMNLVVRYHDGAGGFFTAERLAVPFVDGGTASLQGPWITDANNFAAVYSNTTSPIGSASVNRYVSDLRGLGDATGNPTRSFGVISNAITTTIGHVSVATNATLQGTFSTCTIDDITNDPNHTCTATHPSQIVTDAVDGTLTNFAFDASAKLLPWVSAPNLVAANNILTVSAPTGTGAYAFAEVDLTYTRNTDLYTWRIFQRHLGDVHLPSLPSTIPTDPTPKATDAVATTHAYLGRSDAITSWHDVVSDPYDALGACEASTDPTTKRFDVKSAALSRSSSN